MPGAPQYTQGRMQGHVLQPLALPRVKPRKSLFALKEAYSSGIGQIGTGTDTGSLLLDPTRLPKAMATG